MTVTSNKEKEILTKSSDVFFLWLLLILTIKRIKLAVNIRNTGYPTGKYEYVRFFNDNNTSKNYKFISNIHKCEPFNMQIIPSS